MATASPPGSGIPIRTRLSPALYSRFRCLADGCRDTCCRGWRITFSKKDYLTLKRTEKSPSLEAIARRAVRRIRGESTEDEALYAEFSMQNRVCPFFNEQGLCALQLECGESVLPYVCRSFPRSSSITPADRLAALSPACEGVLKLLWAAEAGIDFVLEDLPSRQWTRAEDTPGNRLFPLLRERCIDILQTRSFSLERRLLILGVMLDQVRQAGWALDGEAWSRRADLLLSDPALTQPLAELPSSRSGFLANCISIAAQFAPTEDFFRHVCSFLSVVKTEQGFSYCQAPYDQAARKLTEELGGRLDAFFENLLVILFFFQQYPSTTTPETVWESFVNLCNMWAMLRFSAVVGYGLESTLEGMFHGVVMASRSILHSSRRISVLQKTLFSTGSADLAHLAVLIQG